MELPNRRKVRLKDFDYSTQNYYFVTICTDSRKLLFGNPNELNFYRKIAENELINIQSHFKDVKIDKYVIMPNHIHALIVIGCNAKTERSRPFPTLSTVIGLYKSSVSKQIHKTNNTPVWQKSFYDRIVRNYKEYQSLWQYIDENPLKWTSDKFYT